MYNKNHSWFRLFNNLCRRTFYPNVYCSILGWWSINYRFSIKLFKIIYFWRTVLLCETLPYWIDPRFVFWFWWRNKARPHDQINWSGRCNFVCCVIYRVVQKLTFWQCKSEFNGLLQASIIYYSGFKKWSMKWQFCY